MAMFSFKFFLEKKIETQKNSRIIEFNRFKIEFVTKYILFFIHYCILLP